VSSLALGKSGLTKTHVIAATTIGTALEFYDFTIYSFFAIQIGQLFFPGATPVNQFLLLIGVFVAGQIVPVLVMIPELFPKDVRATGIALTYVVSASFFGGFSPFIASWLVAKTGNPLAPAWYVAAACAISLVPVIWLKDRTGEALN
jgi:hypothetical protein